MSDPAYFLYHSIGLYPGKDREMARALGDFATVWGACDDAQWPKMLGARQTFIDLWCDLIDAPAGTLTSADNVTAALYSVIGGMADRLSGRTVLIAADCFPSLHFLLNGLADRIGFTLRTVPLREGGYWVEDDDMIAAWGPDVALAILTFVTSTASHRPDLDRLLAHGREMGSLVGIDLTQGIGIVPFSVVDTPVDFAISTTLKWLCGTPGAGIIQMRPELIAASAPELRGWFSQDNPFSWDLEAFDYAPDARRFDHGTPSVMACVGSVPALRWHAAQSGLQAHNRALTDTIIEWANARGVTLASPASRNRRGGSVMLHLPSSVDPAQVVDSLRDANIFADARGPILRLSPGAVTRMQHVTRLCDALDTLV
ncbi:aminotransferase class V-fold PLP-dependent enzyme [Sulfitobacter sp. S190]|uniref:aminotransferase class V-fold PLP-dependent enzyme n=1 Tax=Sulfitobacter sp. S190 TaxID=2867022 RepID=UPI0021A9140A|nr:aminotransferase class V-fold PLP-dependent enzyme [Sulfitobacter sp. S190]UWR24462.1 aminotransferase class V-fold PLP-dependent enzyme [Sulfitobacter sp. S190]UWR24484.1 aminotransferase class V-fold PLP-dependent enzyme [Sulfitobacter sp. S190]